MAGNDRETQYRTGNDRDIQFTTGNGRETLYDREWQKMTGKHSMTE